MADNTAESFLTMYCQGSADMKSTFFLVLQGWLLAQFFSFFSVWRWEGKEFDAKGAGSWSPLCGSKSVVFWTPSVLFPNWHAAGRPNSSLWVRDLRGWCPSLLTVVLQRAETAAVHWEPAHLLQLQSSSTCVILFGWMGCWCLVLKSK